MITSAAPIVLALDGELCIAELVEVRSRIDDALASGVTDLVLDLAGVTLLTAAALRVLNTTEHRLRTQGGTLRVRNPTALARRVLEITGFADLIEV